MTPVSAARKKKKVISSGSLMSSTAVVYPFLFRVPSHVSAAAMKVSAESPAKTRGSIVFAARTT